MASSEMACVYAALILHDESISITEDKISALVKAANVDVEAFWPSLFAKLLQKVSVDDIVKGMSAAPTGGAPAAAAPVGGAAPAEEEKKEEEAEEESDEDMGFGLFD
ncbi:hypothetical protein BU14_0033s0002 [Porphyra umbilicalis]|uniref:60S acidic ribosomal protein P1 n=1 Tax=Porphyra umbilicalis TaxID=2786 RepID=A0A1X6PIJ4_PORUM|nr:hypothetical protein BU14_0033s0002 [Porphyra umbilicalis]|eukprot:OSX80657.1 hypothetical protein BU14_0033s0002 [Porphyra umbilicalis]